MNALFQESILVTLILSGVPLVAAACTGLCVSLIQAVTQVQEQTISYSVKLLTLILVLSFFAEAGVSIMLDFSVEIFDSIGRVAL